jgi:predicted dehydrogenase
MDMASKVRIGIIGVGIIGKTHVAGYQPIPEAEIVAICDVREEEARSVAAQYNIPNVYTDYHEMLKRDDIDAVDVCLHNRFHASTALDAFAAGKHVYSEKPISWTYSEAKSMCDAAKASGKLFNVQLATVLEPGTRCAKRIIDEGLLGEIYYAKFTHFRRRGRPFVDGYATKEFVNTDTSGGGATIDLGVYHIGRMLYLLGNPDVLTVSGATYQKLDMYEDRRAISRYNVDELGIGLVRLAGGITFSWDEAWAINSEDPNSDYVCGAKGGLRVDPLTFFSTMADLEMAAAVDVKSAITRWERCNPVNVYYAERHLYWISVLLGRIPQIDMAGLALKAAFIGDGVYLSNHYGREVTAKEIETTKPGLGRV